MEQGHINAFYTIREYCDLYDVTTQQLTYLFKQKKVDYFEKGGRKFIVNNEKNNEYGRINKENKAFKSKYN
jgi:phage antirepressor YoqD-like protein